MATRTYWVVRWGRKDEDLSDWGYVSDYYTGAIQFDTRDEAEAAAWKEIDGGWERDARPPPRVQDAPLVLRLYGAQIVEVVETTERRIVAVLGALPAQESTHNQGTD